MQQIKCIIMPRQSQPWPYACIYALICAVKYAHFMHNGNQALLRKKLIVASKTVLIVAYLN